MWRVWFWNERWHGGHFLTHSKLVGDMLSSQTSAEVWARQHYEQSATLANNTAQPTFVKLSMASLWSWTVGDIVYLVEKY